MQLLKPDRTAYAWLYLGDAANPYTVLRLHPPGRGEQYHPSEVPRKATEASSTPTATPGYNADPRQAPATSAAGPTPGGSSSKPGKAIRKRATKALAFIRTLYAVEREIAEKELTRR